MRTVVDASIAVKWYFRERNAEAATRVLAEGNEGARELLAPDWMCVPGPITSGLVRWPGAGPRLEKLMTSLALSAPELPTPQPSVQPGRTFSDAPTVITFLPAPGDETVAAPGPSFAAANR